MTITPMTWTFATLTLGALIAVLWDNRSLHAEQFTQLAERCRDRAALQTLAHDLDALANDMAALRVLNHQQVAAISRRIGGLDHKADMVGGFAGHTEDQVAEFAEYADRQMDDFMDAIRSLHDDQKKIQHEQAIHRKHIEDILSDQCQGVSGNSGSNGSGASHWTPGVN